MTIKKRLFITVVLSSIALLFLGSVIAYFAFIIKQRTAYMNDWVDKRIIIISAIEQNIGYGGAIHHFKNYLLRKDEAYYTAFKNNISELKEQIAAYERLQNVTTEEIEQLKDVKRFIVEYDPKIEKLHEYFRQNNPMSVRQMDREVKVDDEPILDGLRALVGDIFETREEVMASLYQKVIFLFAFIGILLPLMMTFYWLFGRRTSLIIENGLNHSSKMTRAIINGHYDYKIEVTSTDEFGQLHQQLNKMADRLYQLETQREEDDWLKAKQNDFLQVARSQESRNTKFFQRILAEICTTLNSSIGVLYLTKEERLVQQAHYGLQIKEGLSDTVAFGEGLIGQAAFDNRIIIVPDLPQEHFMVVTGTGASYPKESLIIPLSWKEQVMGVLEVGKTKPFSSMEKTYLKLIASQLALEIKFKNDFEYTLKLLHEANTRHG